MPEFGLKDCKRIAAVVKQVENAGLGNGARRDIRAVPQVPEIRAVRITSTTLDADGFYPGQLIQPDSETDPVGWDDITECRVQAYQGTLTVGRIRGERIGENDDGLPIFSPCAEDFSDEIAALGDAIPSKKYVRAATTGNITLSGEQTIDGVSILTDEDVLVRAQSSSATNGVYTASTGAWTRRADLDEWAELVGALVVVSEGTTLADTLWLCTSNTGGTLGSTAVTWARIGTPTIVRDSPHSVTVSPTTTLTFAVSTGGTLPFTVTDLGSGEAYIGIAEADLSQVGTVTLAEQWMGQGYKKFANCIEVRLGSGNYQIELNQGSLNAASIRATGTTSAASLLIRVGANDIAGYTIFAAYGIASGVPVFQLSTNGMSSGITPAFSVIDSDSNTFVGVTVTENSVVYKGGLRTGGTFALSALDGGTW